MHVNIYFIMLFIFYMFYMFKCVHCTRIRHMNQVELNVDDFEICCELLNKFHHVMPYKDPISKENRKNVRFVFFLFIIFFFFYSFSEWITIDSITSLAQATWILLLINIMKAKNGYSHGWVIVFCRFDLEQWKRFNSRFRNWSVWHSLCYHQFWTWLSFWHHGIHSLKFHTYIPGKIFHRGKCLQQNYEK